MEVANNLGSATSAAAEGASDDQILDQYSRPDASSFSPKTLDDVDLEIQCPLDNGRHDPLPPGTLVQSAGQLDLLPLELISEILILLDIPTLTTFRRVNHRAMELVNSLLQYRVILEHCPDVLRAILSVGANSFDLGLLYMTLATDQCATCDQFGNYLYLINCTRVCNRCVRDEDAYLPLRTRKAKRVTRLPSFIFDRIPRVTSLPGTYTSLNIVSPHRIECVDMLTVRAAAQHIRPNARFPEDAGGLEPRRFMFIISAPYVNGSDQTAKWGVYCSLCRKGFGSHYGDKFTEYRFLEHFRNDHGSEEDRETSSSSSPASSFDI